MSLGRGSTAVVWKAAAVAVPILSPTLHGQQLRSFLPQAPLAPTIRADPREPAMGGKLMWVADGATLFGTGLEGEAILGASVPLVLLSGETTDRAVVLALQGGVFGRFAMDNRKRDLISSDWVFAMPLFVWRGENWFRFRYRHFSSHLGDEYIKRFATERANFTRDAIGFMAYRHVTPSLVFYGGGDVAFNVDPNDAKRLALQGGVEFTQTTSTGVAQPYWGIDVLVDQDSSWKPRVNVQAGAKLFPQDRRRVRLVFELLFGSSPQGEFHHSTETVLSLGIVLEM